MEANEVIGEAQQISEETQKATNYAKQATSKALDAIRGMDKISGDVEQVSEDVAHTINSAFSEDPAQKHLIRTKTDNLKLRAEQLRAQTQGMREKIAAARGA